MIEKKLGIESPNIPIERLQGSHNQPLNVLVEWS